MKKSKGLHKFMSDKNGTTNHYKSMTNGPTLEDFENFIRALWKKHKGPTPENPAIFIQGGYTADMYSGINAFTFKNDGINIYVSTDKGSGPKFEHTWQKIDYLEFINNKHIKYIN